MSNKKVGLFSRFLSLLAAVMLLSPPGVAFATYFPAQETITVGGRTLIVTANMKILYCATAGGGARCSFRDANGSSGYQVPGGKTFTIKAVGSLMYTASTVDNSEINYSDNDVGIASGTTYTNPVYMGNSSAISPFAVISPASGGVADMHWYLANFVVPTGKFIGANENASSTWVIIGYEN